MRRPVSIVVMLAVLSALCTSATTQRALLTSSTIVRSTLPTSKVGYTVVQLPAYELEAGRPVSLWGRLAIASEGGSLMGTAVHCVGPDGTRYMSTASTTNHLGPDWPVGTVNTVDVHWLFTPEQTGPHTCELQGLAALCAWKDGVCVWQPQYSVNVVDGTTLMLNPLFRDGGRGWGQPADVMVTRGDPSKWVLVKRWDAPADVTRIRVHTGPELTSVSSGGNRPNVSDVGTYITQLHADGTKCARTVYNTRHEIDGDLHHLKVNHVRVVDVDPTCTSRRFAIQVKVTYVPTTVAGELRHDVMVHDSQYSSAYAAPAKERS